MRLLKLLAASLLSCTALAATKGSKDKFATYHARASSGPLELDDKSFEELTSTPRDYSVAVVLTALEARFGCQICKEFQPEWDLITKSYNRGDKIGEGRLLFGTLDFLKGKNTFQKAGFSPRVWKQLMCLTMFPVDAPNRPSPLSFPTNCRSQCQSRHITDPL